MRTLLLGLVALLSLSQAFAITGLEVAKKVDEYNKGYVGEESTLEMKLINAHGDEIKRKMESKTLEVLEDGDKSVIEFLWPADVKGTKMLTWSHKEGNDDQWLYLPAMRRVKRISSRNKSGSFMGSEFSYEDLGSQEVDKFTYKFIKEEKKGKDKYWVIERYPKDKKSGYSKQLAWVDQGRMLATKTEYYDRKGELLKTATFENFKKYKKFHRAEKLTMVNHQTKKKSILEWSNRSLFKKFSSSTFNKSRLK